tara:strand:+ start:612 stop:1292 length:681 start_codon:yes stop_codon:yes gene_type:complete
MTFFCFDDFYYDPDAVRDYALNMDYDPLKDTGIFPGLRTTFLHNSDPEFFGEFCKKLFSLYTNDDLEWSIRTTFQKLPRFSEDKNSKLNEGWIHRDNSHMAAVVYLDPDPDPDSGTSFYAVKNGMKAPDMGYTNKLRNNFFCYDECDKALYEKELVRNNSHFYKTAEIKNVYNRIIIYDASTYHTQTSCYTNGDFRLTQPVFMTCGSSIESRPPWLKGIGSPACML